MDRLPIDGFRHRLHRICVRDVADMNQRLAADKFDFETQNRENNTMQRKEPLGKKEVAGMDALPEKTF
ncbi:MAG: hypothetical protein J0H42_12550 [Rhizobiales bacterium]|nr:hypothetical protein [Hyphomicrobiales bacterium]